MTDLTTQHALTLGPDRVVKRFTRWDRGEPHREWRGLTLLAEHAPGLAPHPLTCELTATPPAITMTRLPGGTLRGTHLDATRTVALATAVTRLHEALPRHVLASVPPRAGYAAETAATLRTWYDARPGPDPDPAVERAFAAAGRWLAGPDPDRLAAAEPEPVMGLGDGNLANYLWDSGGEPEEGGEGAGGTGGGALVRMVDFEDSGRSDRAFELADLIEHVSAWADSNVPADALLARLDLTSAETARLRTARRLMAVVWLFLLQGDARSDQPRNPPGTLSRQAVRVRERFA